MQLSWRLFPGRIRELTGIKLPRMSAGLLTLYPVLRRLQKEECLETYDMAIDGRNRRYYKITENGRAQLNLYKSEWSIYSRRISEILGEV